jgi:hypothetical protein
MPEWMHNRAEHILAKNPSMPKSEAFAIATQQMHAGGHGPKGYGTVQGRRTAKAKYDTPKNDEQRSNPGSLESPKMKHAAIGGSLVRVLSKIGFASSAYGGQPAQNGPGMRGQSQIPPFVAPPLEVKQAASIPKGVQNFAKAVKGEGPKLRATAARHVGAADTINGVLGSRGSMNKTVNLPPMRGGWAHTTKALETDARRHTRAAHLAGTLADVASKETLKARSILGGGMAAAGTAGAAVHSAHASKEKEAGMGVGSGMSTSQYSGPLSYGPFKQTSQIPPFTAPPIEQAKTASPATGAMGAAGKLRATQRVGGPKVTGFAGPSISEIAKPKGFGKPLSGTLKNQL